MDTFGAGRVRDNRILNRGRGTRHRRDAGDDASEPGTAQRARCAELTEELWTILCDPLSERLVFWSHSRTSTGVVSVIRSRLSNDLDHVIHIRSTFLRVPWMEAFCIYGLQFVKHDPYYRLVKHNITTLLS